MNGRTTAREGHSFYTNAGCAEWGSRQCSCRLFLRSGSGQATRGSRAETTTRMACITGPIGQLIQVNSPRTSAKRRATATRLSGSTMMATTLLILAALATTTMALGAKCGPRCRKATGCGNIQRPSSTGLCNCIPTVDRTGRTRIPTRRPFWTLSTSFRS